MTKPVTGTREWAERSANLQTGCEHACRYCYASAMAVRFGRATPETWASPIRGKLPVVGKRKGRTMFPTTHDITEGNLDACLAYLRHALAKGNEVLIVSKPTHSCVRALCRELWSFKAQVTFRFTIGSTSDTVLKLWEPGAPGFAERRDSLFWAFHEGFKTSVSAEPMLDLEPQRLVPALMSAVDDTLWFGLPNNLLARLTMNQAPLKVMDAARALIRGQDDAWLRELYERYRFDPQIRWKDSIKQRLGLERPTDAGGDV